MNARTNWMGVLLILAVGAVVFAFTVGMSAQVQTTKSTTAHAATQEVKVERAEVILVSGNDVVVKMEDGSIRHVSNVPESTRITVDGKELGVHDLQPGMKLQRTITTTTTPKTITTVKSVKGKVWHIQPPSSVILTMENGENQSFKIPKGQKFNVDGQMVDAWGLKKGMLVSATKVVEEPITVTEQQRKLTGQLPPPPPPPAADMPILIAAGAPAPAPAAEEAPKALPKTGGELPLGALLGFLSLAGAAGVRFFRTIRG